MTQMPPAAPRRIRLARTPTPLEHLERLSRKVGVDVFFKRDDMTGTELSGNKIRKLEYVLADALAKGADTVLTCGGAQSNHCRASAAAAAQLGLNCRLLLRTPDPARPPRLEANSLLDRLFGAGIVWVSVEEYKNRAEVFKREAALLREQGRTPYIIPEGASNALGAWGYIRAMSEIAADSLFKRGNEAETTLVYAAGSGGTGAGLILGRKLFGLKTRVVGINVCDDRDYFVKAIGEICEQAIDEFGLGISFSRDRDIEIIDGYVGRGYALSRPEELEAIRDLARLEGVVLDPVYTGKAFFGLTRELAAAQENLGKRIIFVHTGGLFGLFAKSEELAGLL